MIHRIHGYLPPYDLAKRKLNLEIYLNFSAETIYVAFCRKADSDIWRNWFEHAGIFQYYKKEHFEKEFDISLTSQNLKTNSNFIQSQKL